MERTLLSRKDLCERWGLSYSTICNYEYEGKLTRNPNFQNPMYYLEEVVKLESLKEFNPLSPVERIKLENKIESLEKELNFCKGKLTNIKMILG